MALASRPAARAGVEEASLGGAGVGSPRRGGRGPSGWGLAAAVLLAVLGQGAPPALAQGAMPEGCAAALAAVGTRWDGLPMEQFTWDGQTTELPELLGAGGALRQWPPDLLPLTNRIGCLLVAGRLALVDGKLACSAYADVMARGDDTLLWVARHNAATNQVTLLRWTGSAFQAGKCCLRLLERRPGAGPGRRCLPGLASAPSGRGFGGVPQKLFYPWWGAGGPNPRRSLICTRPLPLAHPAPRSGSAQVPRTGEWVTRPLRAAFDLSSAAHFQTRPAQWTGPSTSPATTSSGTRTRANTLTSAASAATGRSAPSIQRSVPRHPGQTRRPRACPRARRPGRAPSPPTAWPRPGPARGRRGEY